MLNTIIFASVTILSVTGFLLSLLRLFNNPQNQSLTIELMLLFMGLTLTLWKLSYFSVLLATIGGLGVLLETKNK